MDATPQTAPSRRPRKAAAPSAAPRRDYAAIAGQFERDVLTGAFPASRNFRAAIERQVRDLASPPAGYVFDDAEAGKWLLLTEQLPWAEGPKRGELIVWEPWQVWLLWTFFGWYDAVTREPRFNTLSLWVGKGNGKSPMAAAIAAALLARDRTGGKLYSAATTAKQARIVLDHAREMLKLAPRVRERFKLEVREHSIVGVDDPRSYTFATRESDTAEGFRPECGIILDEVHVADRRLYGNLQTAINKTAGARFIQISTAGMSMDPQDCGYQQHRRAVDILTAKTTDERTLAVVIDADPELEFHDEKAIRQANPNLGVSVSLAGIKAAVDRARRYPQERADVEVKHLNRYQQAGRAFLDRRLWDALAVEDLCLTRESVDGWTIFVGVDLAKSRDLTAAVYVAARLREDGQREYLVFCRRVYLPEKSPTLEHLEDARIWEADGWICLAPGRTVNYAVVVRDIVEDLESVDQASAEACVDEWSASQVEASLAEKGLTVVEVKQTARMLSEPMKELEAAVIDGRLHHDGSPVMAMAVGNMIAVSRGPDAIKPDREDEHQKIDPAAAMLNAMVRASVADLDGAIYSKRGLVSV
jgi:phage terminase large subunit-like protein